MDKVCFIEFTYDEDVPAAYIYFQGRRQPLVIQAESMEDLIAYFHKNTLETGKENDAAKGNTA